MEAAAPLAGEMPGIHGTVRTLTRTGTRLRIIQRRTGPVRCLVKSGSAEI